MWITYPPTHILLKASLSCTFLKTTKLSSRWLSKDEVQQWDTCPRTHRVALDWLFDRINLEPKIQIKYVDTKNQLADMLTKESFTRDEWNHLLRLFNIMSFSMFSCSHFSNFLSDPIGKQSAMSKRGQEATSSEGSPMAKPKPMAPAKARPVNLVSRSPWSARENPRRIWDIRSIRGMSMKDKVVRLVQGNLYGPPKAQKSNVLKWGDRKMLKDSDSWKQCDKEESSNSTGTRRLVRAATPRTEFQNMKYTNHQYMTKVFHFLQKKLGITAGYSTLSMEALKTNVLTWRMFMSSSMKAAIHLGPNDNWRTWRVTRTRTSRKFRACSISHRNWYWSILKKFWMCVRLKVHLPHGRDQYCLMIMWSSGQEQNYVSTQIPYCVWGRCMKTKMQVKDGKVKWKNSKCPLLTKNCWESMENQLNSSGIFSKDFRHCRFFRKSRMICESGTWNLRDSQTGSSSCQCSTTSIGQEKETMEFVFRIQKSQGIREKILAGTLDVSRSWRRKEVVWNSSLYTWRKMGLYSHSNGGTIQRYRSSSIQEYQCFESWNPEKKNNRDTIHFNADASNTELLFRIIHSVNQLSIYGAVSNWCEQFGLTEEEKGQKNRKNPWPKVYWQVWNHKK